MEYKKIGSYIRQVDERNAAGRTDNLLGLSVQKTFMPSIANTIGTDFTKYKVVKRGQFTYIPDTSRRGDKIAVALLRDCEQGLVSNVYTVFEVTDTNALDPEYLMLWFQRPEFDRYARFHSHGSVRELFDWNAMCDVEIPFPPIDVQRELVYDYKVISDRIALKRRINACLESILATIFSQWFLFEGSQDNIKLGDIMAFSNGKARPKTNGNIPVYGGNGILSFTDRSNAANVVLIGRVGAYCGSVYLEQNPCWVSDNAIYAKSAIVQAEYFDYFLLKNLNLYSYHIGTGQQLLTQDILNTIIIPKPDVEKIALFNAKAAPIFSLISMGVREISNLQKLSSSLLPLLKRELFIKELLQAAEDARNGINVSGPFRTAEEAVASMLED